MKLALRLPTTPEGLTPFLEAIAGHDGWDGIEMSAAILDTEHGWEDLLDAFALPLLSVHSLLPVNVSRYLAEAGDVARHALLSYIRALLEKAAAAGIDYTSIDLGADREADGDDARIKVRADMLRSLMPLAEGLEVSVCLPRRLPRHQLRKEPDATLRLVNDVAHRCCRIALNVYPDELPDAFDVRVFLRGIHLHLGLIRWHYEPHLGIHINQIFCGEWLEALRWLGYRGPLIFCPRHLDAATFQQEVVRLDTVLA